MTTVTARCKECGSTIEPFYTLVDHPSGGLIQGVQWVGAYTKGKQCWQVQGRPHAPDIQQDLDRLMKL